MKNVNGWLANTVARLVGHMWWVVRAPASLALCCLAIHGVITSPAAAAPPVITSVTVTSFSTGDNHSIAMPQVRIPELEIRGTDFFPSGSTGPLVILRRPGYPDRQFIGSSNTFGGDATDGWVKVRNVDLSFPTAYAPGSFEVLVQRPPLSAGLIGSMPNAFELKPQGPERLVRRGGFGGPINRVQPVGNLLYMNTGPRFVILDATNETSPIEVGSIDLLTPILDFQIRGNYAFVCAQSFVDGSGSNGFCVVDISNPASPRLVWTSGPLTGIIRGPGTSSSHLDPERVWLKGSFAYVASGAMSIYVFDISNPSAPFFVRPLWSLFGTGLPDGLRPGAIEIVGSYLYGWSWPGGAGLPAYLRVYDLGPSSDTPIQIAQVQCSVGALLGSTEYPACFSAVPGTLAFVTAGPDVGGTTCAPTPQLWLWDISNPASPTLASQTPLARTPSGLCISSGRLFVAEEEGFVNGNPLMGEFTEYPDTSRGLLIYDIATAPTNPTLLGSFKTHGSVYGVNASSSRAYVRDHGDGLVIVDHSNPSSPMRLGGYYSPSTFRDLARNGNLVYVSDQYIGFTTLNIANPDRPEVVGVYRVNHAANPDLQGNWGIAYRNGKVYLAVGDGRDPASGIDVVDVVDPAHPVLVQAFDAPEQFSFRGLEVDGNILHAGAWRRPTDLCGLSNDPGEFWNFSINPVDGTITPIASVPLQGQFGELMSVAFPQTINGFTFCEAGTIDNRNPLAPNVLLDPNCYRGVAPGGDYLYISGQRAASQQPTNYGLFMREILDPSQLSGRTEWPGNPSILSGIAHDRNGRLFVDGFTTLVGASGGLHLLDTAVNPANPRIVASMLPFSQRAGCTDTSNVSATMVKVVDSLVLTADRAGNYRSAYSGLIAQGLMIAEHIRPPACPADFNGSGGLSAQDIFDFLNAWFAGDNRADFNHLNGLSVQDIFDFLNAWFAGC